MARTPASATRRLSPPLNERGWPRPEFFQRHVHHGECASHEAIDALGSKAEVARPKGHIFGHGFGEELEFGKLEGQANALTHASRRLRVDGAAVEEHAAARGFESRALKCWARVVLPAPLVPTMAKTEPVGTSISMSQMPRRWVGRCSS